MSNSSISRKGKGRQKVEMKKMTNENNLQVTFSKRRTGVFKKASELCTLTGAEVALVVFSPGDKAYSFGHPNIEAVVKRYLTGSPPSQKIYTSNQFLEAHRNANICDLNAELTEVMNQLEAEKKHGEELDKQRKAMQANYWWAAPPDELTGPELQKMKEYLEGLQKNLTRETDRRLLIQSACNNLTQFHAGSSSSSDQVLSPLQAKPGQVFPPLPRMIQKAGVQNPMMFDGNMGPLPPQGFNNVGGYGLAGPRFY